MTDKIKEIRDQLRSFESFRIEMETFRDKALDNKSFAAGQAKAYEDFVKILLQKEGILNNELKKEEQKLEEFQNEIKEKLENDITTQQDVGIEEDVRNKLAKPKKTTSKSK